MILSNHMQWLFFIGYHLYLSEHVINVQGTIYCTIQTLLQLSLLSWCLLIIKATSWYSAHKRFSIAKSSVELFISDRQPIKPQ